MFVAAAQVLRNMAMSESNIALPQRMEYLSRALANMKSGDGLLTSEDTALLGELQEAVEVANVQLELLNAVKSLPDTEAFVDELSFRLLDVSVVSI
jgi:hypothetical protein